MEGKTKMWPVLKPCKHQCSEANDLLSRLPDDLVCFIMSFLTMKEAARTSVLSHRWNYLWHCFSILVFEDLPAMESLRCVSLTDIKLPKRLNFSNWVNRIVEAHCGQYVDEMRVTFDLDRSFQSDVDKWLVFAIAKQVKHLQLDFSATLSSLIKRELAPKWRISLDQPQNLSFFKSCLRSLSLSYVCVTDKDAACLLRSCLVLENLSIIRSLNLVYVRYFRLPTQLKHLEVSYCKRLKAIDILAPKLVSFKNLGNPVELHIRSASMLSKLSFGALSCAGDVVTPVFGSLSTYFQQLEYLNWKMLMSHGGPWFMPYRIQYNLGIKNPPTMKNLKHLELEVSASCEQSLFGWVDLLEVSPILERLTMKFLVYQGNHRREIMRRNGRPLKSLKTLELHGDLGLPIDLEFVTYVVRHSIVLKDVIVELRPLEDPLSDYVSVDDQVAKLRQIVPQGVNFTLNMVDN